MEHVFRKQFCPEDKLVSCPKNELVGRIDRKERKNLMLPQLSVDSKSIFHLDHYYSHKCNYNIFYCNFMAHCQAPALSLQWQIVKYLETVRWKLRKGGDDVFVFHYFRNMQTGCILSFGVRKIPLGKTIHFHFRGIIWVSSNITVL